MRTKTFQKKEKNSEKKSTNDIDNILKNLAKLHEIEGESQDRLKQLDKALAK